MQVQMLTVGPVQENTFLVKQTDGNSGFIVDPGDEASKILSAMQQMGLTDLQAILLTHTHFDHIGAVADVAAATGAQVWCPRDEVEIMRDPNEVARWFGMGPFKGYDPENLIDGGEKLEFAGFEIDVLHTPGHSPGHMTFALADQGALFSGDVLFQSSVGRTDLPGGDHATLMRSIAMLVERFDDATQVFPGHMGVTTIGQEKRGNPFLLDLDL